MPNNNAESLLVHILKLIHKIEDGILAVLLIVMLLLASSQIFLRNFLDIGFAWADPLLRIMVLWLGLLGALAASRDNKHITIDVLTRMMSPRARHATRIFTSLFTAIVTGIIAYHSVRFVVIEYQAGNIALSGIPAWQFEIILPIAFALISLRYVIHFVLHLRNMSRRVNTT